MDIINKSNSATPQRPEGDRVLDASLVNLNLNASIAQLQNEVAWKEGDRNSITLFKSDEVRVVLMGLHKGVTVPTHTAPGMITVQVLQGHIHFFSGGTCTSIEQGQAIVLHQKLPHSLEALQDTFLLLTMVIIKKEIC